MIRILCCRATPRDLTNESGGRAIMWLGLELVADHHPSATRIHYFVRVGELTNLSGNGMDGIILIAKG